MHLFPDSRPLQWPDGWPRRHPQSRVRVGFQDLRADTAKTHLVHQLAALGADSVRVSSSSPIGFRGIWTLGDQDPGVAVYFELKGKEYVVASDSFCSPLDNLRAVALGLESLAMMSRFGAFQVYARCLSGLTSGPLVDPEPNRPDPDARPWWRVLGFEKIPSKEEAEKAHKVLIRENHPDRPGGDEERAKAITVAMTAARDYYNDPPANT